MFKQYGYPPDYTIACFDGEILVCCCLVRLSLVFMPGLPEPMRFPLFRSLLLPSQTISFMPGLQPMLSLFGCYTIVYSTGLQSTLLLVGGVPAVF